MKFNYNIAGANIIPEKMLDKNNCFQFPDGKTMEWWIQNFIYFFFPLKCENIYKTIQKITFLYYFKVRTCWSCAPKEGLTLAQMANPLTTVVTDYE